MSLPTVRRITAEGSVVRDCPGTRKHVCCGYRIIDVIEGCPLSCSYCILRGYLNGPGIAVRTDTASIIDEVERAIDGEEAHILRFGTGELSDSLALDRRLGVNEPLVRFFGEKKRALLELKSKWADLGRLGPCLNPYVVVSFSVAPQKMIDREEKRTSPLSKRLKALKSAQERGCPGGLHFDPVVIYEGFEDDYAALIDEIARTIDLKRVIWVSIGCLRFAPRLMKRFLEEKRAGLLYGEFVQGEDGKLRYLKKERVRVYRLIRGLLKEREPGLFVYLCMERPDVWRLVTGEEVRASEELAGMFDERINAFYGGSL